MRLLTVLPIALALTSASVSGGDWPMFRHDPAHSGVAEAAAGAKGGLRRVWVFEAGAEEDIESSAAIAGGTAYLATKLGQVVALDAATGALRWRVKLPGGPEIEASPAVDRGRVFIGDKGGVFHALSADGGKELWSLRTDAEIISSATISGDRVLFGSYDSFLYCVAPADGKVLWKFDAGGQPVHATPAVAGGFVLTAGCDGLLRALGLEDGKEVSGTEIEGQSAASPAVAGDLAIAATLTSRVVAVDFRKGKVAWTFGDPEREFPFHASPAVAGDRVVVGGRDKVLRALEVKTGKKLWALSTHGRLDSSPAIYGGTVYVAGTDGEVLAVGLEKGERLATFNAGAPITASPAIAGGRLVIGTSEGRVYGFDITTPAEGSAGGARETEPAGAGRGGSP
jgi:eukaryotic-like serine/threonine-protein kinase